MKKKVTEQESEIDRINREAKERFDRDMDEYLESPEFVMCECAKGVSMFVTDLVNLVRPTLPQMDPCYADAVKTYLNWVKNTEHEADTLCRLAKTNPTQARVSLDLWDASLTKDPPEYNRLATEIEAAGKNPAWKELDNLRYRCLYAAGAKSQIGVLHDRLLRNSYPNEHGSLVNRFPEPSAKL